MRVHLIKQQTIKEFADTHPRSKSSLHGWLAKVKYADWTVPDDIKATFATADLLLNGTNRVVFDIGGNNFRLICKYAFGKKSVHLFVCWIGSHKEYDRVCADEMQYVINDY